MMSKDEAVQAGWDVRKALEQPFPLPQVIWQVRTPDGNWHNISGHVTDTFDTVWAHVLNTWVHFRFDKKYKGANDD